jgi:hypothetical protein
MWKWSNERNSNPSLQIKESGIPKNDEKVKQNLELLHSQRKKWSPHNRNVLCWSFFYVGDKAKMIFDAPQIMHCMLCHSNPMLSFNPKMKWKEGLISYYKTSGIK